MSKKNLFGYDLQFFAEDNNKDESNANDNNKDDNTNDTQDQNNQNDETGKDDDKIFTQEQVNKLMSREKKQGRVSVLKELGLNPDDKNSLSNLKKLIESQKTEAELSAEKDAKILDAEKRAMLAETKTEAMMKGIKPQYVDDAVTLAMAKMDNETDLNTLLTEFKTKYPMWFNAEDEDNKIGQKGTGSSVKNEESKVTTKGYGAKLAASKNTQNKETKNFWSN